MYLDSELNGLNESSLALWEKQTTSDWTGVGEDSRDTAANYVEKTGILSLGRFTLFPGSAAGSTLLPVQGAFKIWPNPVDDLLNISVTVPAAGSAIIKLVDGKGALVMLRETSLLQGTNLLTIDVKGMAAGVYYMLFSNNNKQQQVQSVMKK